MSRILSGGRAGGLRLKLLLALLWVAGGGDDRHEATFPARAWVEMLDLNDPGGAGQRRVRDALAWLEREGFITIIRRPGHSPKVVLLREDGSGAKYVTPVKGRKDPKTKKLRPEDWSIPLPASFWTNGWPLALSTAGLAMLLVMLEMRQPDGSPQWIAPTVARRRYGLSEDTWTRGTAELLDRGLLKIGKKPVDWNFEWKRVRNHYALKLKALQREPKWA